MRLEMGGIYHQHFRRSALRTGQFFEYALKCSICRPTNKAIVQRLGRAIVLRRIPPTQAIANNEDYPTQDTAIINPWSPVGFWKQRPKTVHPRF